MPTIPTIQASPGALSLPRAAPSQFGAQAFQELTQFGGELGEIAQKIQHTQDEVEMNRLKGQYDAGLDSIKLEVPSLESDPLKQPAKFAEQAVKLQQKLFAQATRAPVRATLQGYADSVLPSHIVDMKARSLKLWTEQQRQGLSQLSTDMAGEVASATTEQARADVLGRYNQTVNQAAARGIINPAEQTQLHDAIYEQTMERTRKADPHTLISRDLSGEFNALPWPKREKVLDQATQDIQHEEEHKKAVHNLVAAAVKDNLMAQANEGKLPDALVQDLAAGRHPYVTAQEGKQILEANAAPISGQGSDQVQAIMLHYALGEPTTENIHRARQQLNKLVLHEGLKGAFVTKAAEKLQADQRQVENTDAVKISKGIAEAKTLNTLETPKSPIKFMNTMTENQKASDNAEITRRAMKGEDPMTVLDEIKKRHEAEQKALPKADQAVDTLLGR